jgi:molybdate transport system substrate-binding protein
MMRRVFALLARGPARFGILLARGPARFDAWIRCAVLASCLACGRSGGDAVAPAVAEPKGATNRPVGSAPPAAAAEVRVAAASDLTPAFEELAPQFEASTGQKLALSFAASGLLAKQIEEGAPFDLFAAANVAFVDAVVAQGACDGASKAAYARGRIVVWARKDAGFPAPSLRELEDPRFKRIAIANPEHAPYGKAAQQALERLGLWQKLQPRLVFGENVKQTLQFARSGNAEVGIVALSLALASDGDYREVPEELHAPLIQALVVCRGGRNVEGARRFAAYLSTPAARAVLARHGLTLPPAAAGAP